MKAWNKIIALSLTILLLLMVVVNIYLFQMREEVMPNDMLVEINRIYEELEAGKPLSHIRHDSLQVQVLPQQKQRIEDYMTSSSKRIITLSSSKSNVLYRFEYKVERIPSMLLWMVNLFFILAVLLLLLILLFVRRQIISPFHQMEDMADALRHRDFTYELPQRKYKFFGKFVWAIDVMKEELRQHEQRELELLRDKKLMISSLSHDIKTPLSNIRLYTDALKEQLYPSETIMLRVTQNCDKIDQYVKDIIQASSADLFDFTIAPHELYLHEILPILKEEEERIALAMTLYKQDIFLTDHLVYADLYRLKEVIHNIVDNALKYGDGKWVHVSFYEEEQHPIIKITNSGKGISELDTKAIFQSFYRGSNVNQQQGNGLGLYICKELMRKMEGDIFMSQEDDSVSFHLVLGIL